MAVRLLEHDSKTVVKCIEYDTVTDRYYLLGFERDIPADRINNFVAYLDGDTLSSRKYIPERLWWFYLSYIDLKSHGFTEKAYKWSYFGNQNLSPDGKVRTLDELKELNSGLAELYARY